MFFWNSLAFSKFLLSLNYHESVLYWLSYIWQFYSFRTFLCHLITSVCPLSTVYIFYFSMLWYSWSLYILLKLYIMVSLVFYKSFFFNLKNLAIILPRLSHCFINSVHALIAVYCQEAFEQTRWFDQESFLFLPTQK